MGKLPENLLLLLRHVDWHLDMDGDNVISWNSLAQICRCIRCHNTVEIVTVHVLYPPSAESHLRVAAGSLNGLQMINDSLITDWMSPEVSGG